MRNPRASSHGRTDAQDPSPFPRPRANGVPSAPHGAHATHHFDGHDGHGLDLTRGMVKMTIHLPLATSLGSPDADDNQDARTRSSAAALESDFEGPFTRIRHKVQLKLRFQAAVGQGWAQSLTMTLPVRFSQAPPARAGDQAARGGGPTGTPHRVRTESAGGGAGGRGGPTKQTESAERTGPTEPTEHGQEQEQDGAGTAGTDDSDDEGAVHLPAYTQLFREDGSRLANEGEDLPRYPGNPGRCEV